MKHIDKNLSDDDFIKAYFKQDDSSDEDDAKFEDIIMGMGDEKAAPQAPQLKNPDMSKIAPAPFMGNPQVQSLQGLMSMATKGIKRVPFKTKPLGLMEGF